MECVTTVPDAKAFLDAVARADEAWASAMYSPRRVGARARTSAEINAEYAERLSEAASQLAKSRHRMLAWIGEHWPTLKRFHDEVCHLLAVLRPNTMLDDLDEMARQERWCLEWDAARDQAHADGAVWYVGPVLNLTSDNG